METFREDLQKKSAVLNEPDDIGEKNELKTSDEGEEVKGEKNKRVISFFGRLDFYTVLATIFLVPLIFSNQTFNILELPKQILLGSLVTLSIFFWLTKTVILSQFKFNRSVLNIAVIVFLISSAISTIGSVSPVTSFLGFYARGNDSFLVIIMLVLFFFVSANSINTRSDLRKMAGTFLLSMGLVAFHALFQVFGVFILPFEMTKSKIFNLVGGVNVLSAVLTVALIFSIALIINNGAKMKISASLLGALSFILLLGLNTTYIWYGLIVSLVAMLGIAAFSINKTDYKLLAIPAFVLITAFIMLYSSSFGLGLPQGGQLDKATAKTIVNSTLTGNLFFGSGPETFAFDYSKFRPTDVNEKLFWQVRFDKANNEYYQLAATRGLLGLLAYVSLFIVLIVLAGTYVVKTFDAFGRSLGIGILSSSVFLAINSYFYFNNTTLIFIIFVLLILTSGLRGLDSEKNNLVSVSTLEAKTFGVVLILISLMGALGTTYAGSRLYRADVAYKEGLEKSITLKTIKNAKKKFAKAVDLNPYRELYHLGFARVNLALANQLDADKDDETTKADEARNSNLYTAISAGQKAVELNPANVENWVSMAVIYRNTGLYASNSLPWIEKCYTEASELEPNNPYLHNSLGQVYLSTEDFDKAIAMFDKAINLKKDITDPYFNLGLAYVQKKDYAKARSNFNEVLKLTPENQDAKKALEDIAKLEKGTAVLKKGGEILDEKS